MKIRWSRRAASELSRTRDYIAGDNPAAAEAVIREIVATAGSLGRFPESGRPSQVSGLREIRTPKYRYVIAYRVKREAVEILAVLHQRRKWPE